jgi:transcriptional regulator with XRE-family HTH domain
MSTHAFADRIRQLIPDGQLMRVAEKAGVSWRTIDRWRKGENDDPRLSTLQAVSGALKISVPELLGIAPLPRFRSVPVADPRLSPARDQISRIRQETEALYRLLHPESVPLEAAGPRIVHIEEIGAKRRKLSPEPIPSHAVRLPIVGARLAAGMGSWPERPDEELRWLNFREDWAALGYPKDHTRYVLAKLGDEDVADSMAPDILPGSLLLLDYSDAARVELVDGRPYLCVVRDGTDEPELAVKYAHRIFEGREVRSLRMVSGNKEKYRPFEVPLAEGQPIQHVVRARVVWWATTVE